MEKYFIVITALCLQIFMGCSAGRKSGPKINIRDIDSLVFLDEYDLPHAMEFENTTVGGLSGIDYDQSKKLYYMVSDDPGANGPSRFYTASILISEKRIDSVIFTGITPILNPEGKPYSDIRQDRTHSLDAEAIRYRSATGDIIYSSEGQRYENKEKQLLIQNPTIYASHRDGSFKDSFALPPNMYIRETENGPRHNSVFEGLSFTDDQHFLFVSMEEPVYEDGPRAATGDSAAWIRFLKFDMQTKKQVAQYAYQTEPVPYLPEPAGAFKINGVSDILYAGHNKFIVIERAYMTGRASNCIRVFLADVSNATDISSVRSVSSLPSFQPIAKKLLINMEILNRPVDNIEGVTWGPVLPDGHRSLLFIADDNFSATQKSQLLLFEVIP